MAIAFAQLRVIGLGQNRTSPVAMAAYIERSEATDVRTQIHHNFKNHDDDLITSKIMLPTGASTKFENFEYAWNEFILAEKSKDKRKRSGEYKAGAQFAFDTIFALPKELSEELQVELIERFAQKNYVDNGVMVHYAIHHKDDNPHAHLIISTREIKGDSIGKKVRKINPKFINNRIIKENDLGSLASTWVSAQNQFFQEKGLDLKVDPTKIVSSKKLKRGENQDYIKKINKKRVELSKEIIDDDEKLIKFLTKRYSYFDVNDLKSLLYINEIHGEDRQQEIIDRIKSNDNILTLHDTDGSMYFTTRERRSKDLYVSNILQNMADTKGKEISIDALNILQSQMTKNSNPIDDEKFNVIKNILNDKTLISGIIGKAGTGKSFTIDILRKCYELENKNCIAVAPTHMVKNDLSDSGFEQSLTAHSLSSMIKQSAYAFKEDDVIIIDETGMIASDQLSIILENAYKNHAKVIMVGDDRQLPAIDAGGIFSEARIYKSFEKLNKVYRQEKEEDRNVTALLSQGKTKEALTQYKDKEKWVNNIDSMIESAVENYIAGGTEAVIAFKKDTVKEVNSSIQKYKVSNKEVHDLRMYKNSSGDSFLFGINDEVIITETDKSKNLYNGDKGIVVGFKDNNILVSFDGDRKEINMDKFDENIALSYAITVHKSQGQTYNNVTVLADSSFMWSQELATVALTRHKKDVDIFIDKSKFRDTEKYYNPQSKAYGSSTHLKCAETRDDEKAVRNVWAQLDQTDVGKLSFLEKVDYLELKTGASSDTRKARESISFDSSFNFKMKRIFMALSMLKKNNKSQIMTFFKSANNLGQKIKR